MAQASRLRFRALRGRDAHATLKSDLNRLFWYGSLLRAVGLPWQDYE